MNDSTRFIPTEQGPNGQVLGRTITSPVDNTVRGEMTVPPTHVIPIVFVPGIMGSNLRAKSDITNKKGEVIARKGSRIWNVDKLTSALGWFGKDKIKRQLVLNKDVAEVDDQGLIAEGTEYVVNSGASYATGYAKPSGKTQLAALPIALVKERGWGTVSWFSYGGFLDWLQSQLKDGRLQSGSPNDVLATLYKLAGTTPPGAIKVPGALAQDSIKKLLKFQFPVHAVGYNWLQSNVQSGLDLKNKIVDDIIKKYSGIRGQHCDQVILITHSMGGLVARAATQLHGAPVLGVIHGVQPIDGAAAFYKRLAAGFGGEGSGAFGKAIGWVTGMALGADATETIPMIAYNPGPLELAPNKLYNGGKPWLFIKDTSGKILKALPEKGDPYSEIYLNTTSAWRAVNTAWLNPALIMGNPVAKFIESVKTASNYHTILGGKIHPNTYANFGADTKQIAWGTVTWRAVGGTTHRPGIMESVSLATGGMPATPQWWPDSKVPLGRPEDWRLPKNSSAGNERQLTHTKGEVHMTFQPPTDAGDGTVPSSASGAQIANYVGCKVACRLTGFDHQGSYNNDGVRHSVLDAIVRIVAPVEVSS